MTATTGTVTFLFTEAKAMAAQANPADAALLWGASASLRTEISYPVQPVTLERYEQETAAMRARSGAEAFAIVWSRGQSITLSEACSPALQEAGS